MKLVSFLRDGKAGFGIVGDDDHVVELTGRLSGADNLQAVLEQDRLGDLAKMGGTSPFNSGCFRALL